MCCLLESCPPNERKAAEGYLYGLKAAHRVEGVVGHACGRAEILQEYLDFFRMVGPAALARIVEIRAEQGFAELQPMFHLLREIPPARSMPILRLLLDHDEPKVRSEALKALLDVDVCLEAAEKYLRIALHDPDRRNEMSVLERLGQQESSIVIELLGKYIEGNLSSQMPTLFHCRHAAGILAAKGKEGQSRLFDAFCRLAQSPSRSKRACLVGDILQSASEDTSVHATIKKWRSSLTRRIYLLLSKVGVFK